jgi:hypothetical protein
MFDRTSTRTAPWHVIPSDDKDAARAEVLGILARKLSAGLDLSDQPLDRKILKLASEILGKEPLKGARKKPNSDKRGNGGDCRCTPKGPSPP